MGRGAHVEPHDAGETGLFRTRNESNRFCIPWSTRSRTGGVKNQSKSLIIIVLAFLKDEGQHETAKKPGLPSLVFSHAHVHCVANSPTSTSLPRGIARKPLKA